MIEGPSSGTTIATLMIALALNRPVPTNLIMTGKINLDGRVSSVGEVEEKLEAAKNAGYKHIILPLDNLAQWESAKDDVKEKLKVNFVSKFEEIYNIVFNSLQ